jgi:hypothetical protein
VYKKRALYNSGILMEDEIEDAKAAEFKQIQQISTSGPGTA